MRNKNEIRSLIGEGMLIDAAEAALAYANSSGETETVNGLIAIRGDLDRCKSVWNSGEISFEEFARTEARIRRHLLDRIEELPDSPDKKTATRRIPEIRYKWLVFYLFVISKLLVFAWTFFLWRTKGFLNEEALTAFNALLPGLVLYGAVMFKGLFRAEVDGTAPRRMVSNRFRVLAWLIFTGYIAAQIFLVTEKVKGNISFTTMNFALLAVEAGMGRFVGEITEGMFK